MTTSLNIYVQSDGNNLNDGLSESTALLNWHGVFEVLRKVNIRDGTVFIHFGTGVFPASILMGEQLSGAGAKSLVIKGVPGETLFSSSFTVSGLYVTFLDVEFQGSVIVLDSASAYFGQGCIFHDSLTARKGGHAELVHPIFRGQSTPVAAVTAYQDGCITILDGITFSGTFSSGLRCGTDSSISLGIYNNISINFLDASFSTSVLHVENGSVLTMADSPVITGTAVGKKYTVFDGGKITGITKSQLDALPIGDSEGTFGGGGLTHSATFVSNGDLVASQYLLADGTDVLSPVISLQSRVTALELGGGGGGTGDLSGVVPTARKISTNLPLTGGGDLSADRTLAISAASTSATGVVQLSTTTEAVAGTNATKAVTPAGLSAYVTPKVTALQAAIDGIDIPVGSQNQAGILRLATDARITAENNSEPPTAAQLFSIYTRAATLEGTTTAQGSTLAGHEVRIVSLEAGGGTGTVDLSGVVPITRTITPSLPLTGGGNLSNNLTVAINTASTSATGAVQLSTTAEATTGTNATKAVTPAGVAAHVTSKISTLATAASVTALDTRVTTAEGAIASQGNRITTLEASSGGTTELTEVLNRLDAVESDVQTIGTGVNEALDTLINGTTSGVLRDVVSEIVEDLTSDISAALDAILRG